ncbi:hypothetical protein ISS30_06410 [bacterium]|nr:hypothetical protein [FCB group bacterium]MBL7191311.1 hypothetical protein [bacterium]
MIFSLVMMVIMVIGNNSQAIKGIKAITTIITIITSEYYSPIPLPLTRKKYRAAASPQVAAKGVDCGESTPHAIFPKILDIYIKKAYPYTLEETRLELPA